MRNVAFYGLFTALIFVGAQISIPIGPVPVTLQILFIILSGLILGPKGGFISTAVYVIAGAIGLPIFSGMRGGFSHILGPTGGYIMCFPVASLIAGFGRGKRFWEKVFTSTMSVGIVYLGGWLWLSKYMGDFQKAFFVGVLPFAPIDALKALIASYIAKRLEQYMGSSSGQYDRIC